MLSSPPYCTQAKGLLGNLAPAFKLICAKVLAQLVMFHCDVTRMFSFTGTGNNKGSAMFLVRREDLPALCRLAGSEDEDSLKKTREGRPNMEVWAQMQRSLDRSQLQSDPLSRAPVISVENLTQQQQQACFDIQLGWQSYAANLSSGLPQLQNALLAGVEAIKPRKRSHRPPES